MSVKSRQGRKNVVGGPNKINTIHKSKYSDLIIRRIGEYVVMKMLKSQGKQEGARGLP